VPPVLHRPGLALSPPFLQSKVPRMALSKDEARAQHWSICWIWTIMSKKDGYHRPEPEVHDRCLPGRTLHEGRDGGDGTDVQTVPIGVGAAGC
jgi:hypothetical protein